MHDHTDPNTSDTYILQNSGHMRRALRMASTSQTNAIISNPEILLLVRGMVEPVYLEDDQPIIVGRTDLATGFRPTVDLSSYGAQERGVSREHISLHREGDHLYVTDLGSPNGTFILGQRLTPGEPYKLHSGDELLLGRLAVRILFE